MRRSATVYQATGVNIFNICIYIQVNQCFHNIKQPWIKHTEARPF